MKKLENARFRRSCGFIEVYTDNTMYTIGGPCYHGGDATRSYNWSCVKVGEKIASGLVLDQATYDELAAKCSRTWNFVLG